jgi:hypothetical protein
MNTAAIIAANKNSTQPKRNRTKKIHKNHVRKP